MIRRSHLKVTLLLFIYTFLIEHTDAQDADSILQRTPIPFKNINTPGLNNFSPEKRKKKWIKIDDVIVETFNIDLTPVEKELAKAESMEIRALLNRDTLVLKSIWLQDFTLDEPHDKVRNDPNPLPNYLSLHRRIEKMLVMEDHAYVSGVEHAVQIKEGTNVDTQVARKYTHMWIKELFGWKLATKTYE